MKLLVCCGTGCGIKPKNESLVAAFLCIGECEGTEIEGFLQGQKWDFRYLSRFSLHSFHFL